jgi:hypothetical protein
MIDVPDVERELPLSGKIVAAGRLREANDAREHFVPTHLFARISVEIAHQQPPRADQAHVAADLIT